MKLFRPIAILALLVTPVFAKPKSKVYSHPCAKVWAAVKAATALPHYNHARLDDAQLKGVVSTGIDWWTGKRNLDIRLTGTGNRCTVTVGGRFSGLVHNDKGDLFYRIQEAIDRKQGESAEGARVR